MNKITIETLLKAGVHFGHQTRYWNPSMTPYLYGVRSKIHILDLDKTLPLFQEAIDYVAQVIRNKGKVLFVGTKHAARGVIQEEAVRAGMPYVNYRWLGGMLTNYKTIRQSIKRLKGLEESTQDIKLTENLTKKEILNLQREKIKLSNCLEGIKNMGSLPDAVFLIDVKHEKTALTEANRLGIPVIGVVDSNSSPEGVDYVIPGNDDATRAIRLYCETFAETIIEERAAVQREMLAIKKQAETVAEETFTTKEAE